MSKRVKLSDIAQKSLVSVSMVSLVLRNKPGIPSETRRRILSTAQELGYHPKKSVARSQPTLVQLHSLGLVVKLEPGLEPQANPFYSYVVAGIEEACRQKKSTCSMPHFQ
jgi:LacI family transcriptional regulator